MLRRPRWLSAFHGRYWLASVVTAFALTAGAAVGLGGCAGRASRQQDIDGQKQMPLGRLDDDLGRPVFLNGIPHRLVVIGPGALETVYALGAGSQVVGRDQIADFPPQTQTLPVAGDFRGPFPEKAAALHPDFVIIQGETWDAARVEQWQREIGAPLAALTSRDLRGVASGIARLGIWLGHQDKAQVLSAALSAVTPPDPAGKPISALVEIQRSPLWSAGNNTLVGDVLTTGGFANAAAIAGLQGYAPFGMETLLAHQPDAYVVPSRLSKAKILADLRTSPVLGQLKCIREGRVVVVDGDLLLRPGPRLLIGIQQLRQQARALAAGRK